MQFSKVIGNIDEKLVSQAEDKLSSVFLELGTRYDNTAVGSGIGGDPLIFSLLYPLEHVCTMNMPTAGTDGKRYYWNPKFVLGKDRIGLRIVAYHEAGHALYMHPQRRGNRIPKLWNIAVDYLVNGMAMDDLTSRKLNAADMFSKHLGRYITLSAYAEMLKDPFNNQFPSDGTAPPEFPFSQEKVLDKDFVPNDEEMKQLEDYQQKYDAWRNKNSCFFADPNLEEEMKSPEKIYDYLYSLLPKCPECGTVGRYKKPKSDDKGNDKNKDKGSSKSDDKGDKSDSSGQDQSNNDCNDNCNDSCDHNHGKGDKSCDHGGCSSCGEDSMDIFGFGDTVDGHMDTDESEEKLAKRFSDAVEAAKKMAGHVPGAMEAEVGKLTEPRITWTDVIRGKLLRARSGNDKNDWTRFRNRPLFAGMLTPKRKTYQANFGCLVDCSGSMSADDVSFGLSQLKAIDSQNEGTLTPADCEIYWDKSVKIRRCQDDELTKFKRVGLGGTMFAQYFSDYEKNIGKCDFLIVITDGYLLDTDVAEMKDPGVPVYWIVTAASSFRAPFGKVFQLR